MKEKKQNNQPTKWQLNREAFYRLTDPRLVPLKNEIFNNMIYQGQSVINTKVFNPIYTPYMETVPEEVVGKTYNLYISMPLELERIVYNYFIYNPYNTSKQIYYTNNSKIPFMAKNVKERAIQELLDTKQFGDDRYLAEAHLMSENIKTFAKEAYDNYTKDVHEMDTHTYGVLFTFFLNNRATKHLLSKTPQEMQLTFDIMFNNIHNEANHNHILALSVVRDFYMYTEGNPMIIIFQSVLNKDLSGLISKPLKISRYEDIEDYNKFFKKGIKDAIYEDLRR